MGNIFGIGTKKRAQNSNSIDYDRIVNLVGENCGCQIPGDLIVNILCKLPVKSLIRLKSVCKPWKLLINSHVFIDNHLHRKNPQFGWHEAYGYIINWQRKKEKVGSNIFPVEIVSIVGICNGVICLQTSNLFKLLLMYNPSTREFSFLPEGIDGSYFGFYYLAKIRTYHVISFNAEVDLRSHNTPNKSIDVSIFTLGKIMIWRDFRDVIVPGEIDYHSPATLGTSTFFVEFDHDEHGSAYDIVLWCDLIDVRYSRMNVPLSSASLGLYRCLDVLKESVIMFVYPKTGATLFDIWMLMDDASKGKSWMKYKTIGPLETGIIMNPFEVCWHGRYILCTNKTVQDGCKITNLLSYDLETNQVEDCRTTDPTIPKFVN